jgi:hypothetical protein
MAPKQASQSSLDQPLHHRYHALLAPRRSLSSEQHLMLALIADAVDLSLSKDPANHHAGAQAWEWILGFSRGSVSFEDACDAVGLDYHAIRKYVRRLRGNHLRRHRGN